MYRTHNLNQLRISDINKEVTISGWVSKIRNLGNFIFLDLRDRYGITQVLIKDKDLLNNISQVKNEYVLQVKGTVIERESKNPNIDTGDIEVLAKEVSILSKSKPLPFEINDSKQVNENLRLQYRYLDLRNREMLKNLVFKSNVLFNIRKYLNSQNFLDVDTPVLAKSTPEGARDFLVPSRLYKGEFYALPQSPQLFKQTLMVSGIDRYYQVAKCFRDEDLRSDRQFEFLHVDIEMSYVHQRDVMDTIENIVKYVVKETQNIELYDFPVISYDYAMLNYGSDKPDTRFDLKIEDFDVLKELDFSITKDAKKNLGLRIKNQQISRQQIKNYEEFVKTYHKLKGLIYIKKDNDGKISSSIQKYLTEDVLNKLNIETNETLFISSGDLKEILPGLGALRLKLAKDFNLIDQNKFNYLWVVDFPMFEWSEEDNKFNAQHHPFTSIKKDDIKYLDSNQLERIKTDSYDLVLNGYEIGGGSIRIHDSILQEKVFDKLGLSKQEQEDKFGFFIETLSYGVPPHGGFAFGFDRWVMAMLNESSIKEVIAFPKTNKGQDLMTQSPSNVAESQIKDLNILINK